MRSLSGRRKVLQLFMNLTQWLHIIHALSLLPPPPPRPPPPARLMKTFFWPLPYSGECHSLVCWPVAVCNAAMRSATGFILILFCGQQQQGAVWSSTAGASFQFWRKGISRPWATNARAAGRVRLVAYPQAYQRHTMCNLAYKHPSQATSEHCLSKRSPVQGLE